MKYYFDHDGKEISHEEYKELKEFWVLETD